MQHSHQRRSHQRLLQPMLCLGLAVAAVFLGQSLQSDVVAQPSPSLPPANAPRTFGQAAEDAGYTTDATKIDLSEQDIQSLDGIESYRQAALINLSSNNLTMLDAGAFAGLSNLQELDLSGSQLTTLDPGLFAGLDSLHTLSLHENQLITLDAGLFDGLTSLQRLDLNSNQLTTLDAGLFDGLVNLQTLNLRGNQLTMLDAGLFDGLTSLLRLYLHENQLTTLDAGLFDGLTSPLRLYLHENQLTTLDAGLFDGLVNLQTLSLYANQLSGELNLAHARLQSLLSFSVQHGNALSVQHGNEITSVNLTGASLSQVALIHIVQDMCGGGVVGLDLSGADLTNVTDYSGLREWSDLETLTLTDADYDIRALDAWLTKLPALQTLTLSEDQFAVIAMAVETNLYTWVNDPSHDLILIPAAE